MPTRDQYPTDRSWSLDDDDPRVQVRILALRVEQLGKEKEDIERALEAERVERGKLDDRVATMERTFQRGAGIALALPIVGTVLGVLMAYGKVIFKPWTGGTP